MRKDILNAIIQMEWVGQMNMIAYTAREMVMGKWINTYNI